MARLICGAQRIENGNTVICDGKLGLFFEVTPEKEIVWEYLNPYPTPRRNTVFKIESYPSNYSGLVNLLQQPNNPEKPNGTTNGRTGVVYNYSSFTIDPQGDQVYYLFDWGDKSNSGWIGPYVSGATASASHIWSEKGTYSIKVKDKDIFDGESDWSDPLSITMPRNKQFSNPLFLRLLKQFLLL